MDIVATMPLLPPNACSASQSYVNPGGTMRNGLVTPTGACQDNFQSVTCFKLFGDMESCVGPVGSLTGLVVLGSLLLLFFVAGGKR